ncbi:MAG TPA: 16S rRNA (guanine(966)-N(2))-methyltransferase RsmD [Candidatus Cloacimonadota bacterium]|nr:16S rRNA (guanine(966)-N(2))-methyltransferase RsmD [Candidatus Cloacimonadota bacterium]
MRIITGKYKGRELFMVPGRSTRPTTAFNREVIFSAYQEFNGKRVLDLFAGTGSFGLEALSRGAIWADFVEFASPAIAVLLKNINKLGCSDICHIYRKKVQSFLATGHDPYDIIFLDPPYDKNLVNPTLEMICDNMLLAPEGVIIVEHSPREPLESPYSDLVFKHKSGKTACFSWIAL